METVLVDSGAIVALLNADDLLHRQARSILEEMRKKGVAPLLTNFILAETFSALTIIGPDAARTWLRHNIWPVERASEADERRAREIILGKDFQDISYTDAVSMAIMERLGIKWAFTFDRVFAGKGFSPLPEL